MPCDGSLGAALFMDRYMKNCLSFTLTPPQRFNEPETNAYAVKDLKNCIRFIEETYDVKWDWDAFWEKAEEYNKTTQCMLDKWMSNCTPLSAGHRKCAVLQENMNSDSGLSGFKVYDKARMKKK